MDRRELLIGTAATLAMSASAGAWNLEDALVMGIRYQSWPWGESEPDGKRLSGVIRFADTRPLSWFKPLIADYECIVGGTVWSLGIPAPYGWDPDSQVRHTTGWTRSLCSPPKRESA
jgi:hypothetical protein